MVTKFKKITFKPIKKESEEDAEESEEDAEESEEEEDSEILKEGQMKIASLSHNSFEQVSSENTEPKSPIKLYKVRLFDYLMITLTVMLIILYNTIPLLRQWIDLNGDYINFALDVQFVFIIVAVIPFITYYVMLIFRILRHFWTAYSFLKLRVKLTIIRFNLIYYGTISMIFALIFNIPILSWGTIVTSLILLLILNYKFIFYDEIREDQTLYENMRQKGEKEPIPIHPALLILFPALFILLMIYAYGDGSFKSLIDLFWQTRIASDLGFPFIFYITIALSICWWLVSYVIVIFLGFYEHYHDKLLKYLKFLIFLLSLYLLTKLFIFNFTNNLAEPYESITSLGITGGAGLVMKFAKNRIITPRH